jgi:hypothetical protein
MGREVKRVAVDFEWPLGKIWHGYVNHFYNACYPCPLCEGTGSTAEYNHLKDQWYGNAPFKPEDRGSVPFKPTDPAVWKFAERNVKNSPEFYGTHASAIMHEAVRLASLFNGSWSHHINADDVAALIAKDRLMDFTHTWSKETGWVKKDPPYIPTPQQVNLWSIQGMAHDSSNQWIVVDAECKQRGYETRCKKCDGHGHLWPTKEAEKAYDDWEQTDPPEGTGWQVWETVSEGSPVTPVFATKEGLIDYLATEGDLWDQQRRAERAANPKGWGSDSIRCDPWDRKAAESFVNAGHAMSMIVEHKADGSVSIMEPRDGQT